MIQKPSDDLKLGELLVRNRLISEEQLQQALLVQRAQAVYEPLGEVCKGLGYISRTDLRGILDRYRKRIPLGSLLVKMGDLTEIKLEAGLAARQVTGERLGEVLVKKAFITRPTLRTALGIQLTIPTMPPNPGMIDKKLLQAVNANFLYQRKAVPVHYKKEEDVLTVIMEDPLDVETTMDLEKIFKTRIEPAMLTHGEIKHLLDTIFDPWTKLLESTGTSQNRGFKDARKPEDTFTIRFM